MQLWAQAPMHCQNSDLVIGCVDYPLAVLQFAIEHGPVEIVDFHMKSMVILSSPVLPAKFWKSPIYLVGSAGENIGKPMGKSQDI